MKPATWLFIGAAGLGLWWLAKRGTGAVVGGVLSAGDECARAYRAIPADLKPPVPEALYRDAFLRHCRAAPANLRACFTTTSPSPSAECMTVLQPMAMEFMSAMVPPEARERIASMPPELRARMESMVMSPPVSGFGGYVSGY